MSDTNPELPNALTCFMRAYTKLEMMQNFGNDHHFFSDPKTQLFTSIAQRTLHSVPYEYDSKSLALVDDLSDEQIEECTTKPRLPFPNTWVTLPQADGLPVGVLLYTKGSKNIFARVCVVTDVVEQNLPHEDFPPLLARRLLTLKDGSSFDFFPEMKIDKAGLVLKSNYMESRGLGYDDSGNFIPKLSSIRYSNNESLDETGRVVNTAMILIGATTSKSILFPVIVDTNPPPPPGTNRIRIRLGKLPKFPFHYVRVDLDKIKILRPRPPDPDAKPKDRHWVGAFKYFKPSIGRIIEVREHERYKDSSPFPAVKKMRKVTASGNPPIC